MRIIIAIAVIILIGAGTVFAFTDNGDNTITDVRTGLVWQKQDDGTARAWENAITYCEGLTLAGQSDWRLPNVKELKTIVDITRYNPAIYAPFRGTNQPFGWRFWSSTTNANFYSNAFNAFYLEFKDGTVFSSPFVLKTDMYLVRCVRGGN